jgi:hypothetical protein
MQVEPEVGRFQGLSHGHLIQDRLVVFIIYLALIVSSVSVHSKNIGNGRESAINRALDGITHPLCLLLFAKK